MVAPKKAGSTDKQVFWDFRQRLIETHGFHPNRELVLEVCALLNDIDQQHETRQQKRITTVKTSKAKNNEERASQKACPLRNPDEAMRCNDCRSLQQLFDRIHAIEDVLIGCNLIERGEDHQLCEAGCGTVDHIYTHIRIAIRDPIFDRLNIMEWFSSTGYTWATVIGLFFAPFLSEEDWPDDDDE